MVFSPPPTTLSNNNLEPQTFNNNNLETKINPSILLIIIILSIIFFISGLLHLIIRLLLRPTTRNPNNDNQNNEIYLDHVTVLQGQLQQLFHLHDSGVDQSYIDTLPLFFYKSIIGLKDPFDCAVCLCEFELNDTLRLLPKCSHAFHMECIDTWLLSHSTCPLCRSSLLVDGGGGGDGGRLLSPSGFVRVLESGSGDHSREISVGAGAGVGIDRERNLGSSLVVSNVGSSNEVEFGSGQVGLTRKSCGDDVEEKIVFVKLGKFMNVDVGENSTNTNELSSNNNNNISNNNNNNSNSINNNVSVNVSGGKDDLGSRRCYSMGSFAYVLDEATSLKVPIRNNTPMKKQTSTKKPRVPLKLGHRATMSEYGGDSQREFNGIATLIKANDRSSNHNPRVIGDQDRYVNGNESCSSRKSFSISKIWGRGNNKKGNDYYESTSRRTNNSEIEIEEVVSELEGDNEEILSCYSVDSLVNPTTTSSTNNNSNNNNYSSSSSTRRTLLWLMGRHHKVVHNHSNSLSSIV
ncbi:hypothetical protein vseg_000203 [Gypsophila vaccaria]